MSVSSPRELFDQELPKALAAHRGAARAVDASFRFVISGEDGGDWIVDLTCDPPRCEAAGPDDDAECTVEVSADDFRVMLADGQSGMRLLFEERLKISGDPTLATRLPDLFAAIREPVASDLPPS